MPSPLCEVKDGAGSYAATAGGVDVTPTNTITIRLIDSSADVWSIACVYTDDTSDAATVTDSLVIDTVLRTATFTAPAAGKAYIFRSVVNNGMSNGRTVSSYTTTFGIYTLTGGGDRVLAANETTEGDATFGWIAPVNAVIRSGGGGGSTPGGSSGDLQINSAGSLAGLGGAAGRIVRRNNAGTAWEASADFVEFPSGITTGDLLYYTGSALARIPIGTEGQVLKVVSGVPAWADAGGGGGFDPATLALTGWWRANFSGSPWTGTASAGASGGTGREASEATNPPATGSAVNSLTPADFDGANDRLVTSAILSDFITNSACSGWALFYADTAVADAGAGSRPNNPQFFSDGNQIINFGFSSAGIHIGVLTSASAMKEIVIACATGAWHLAQWKVESGNVKLRLDGGTWSTISMDGNPVHPSQTLVCRMGTRGTGVTAFFDGKILEQAVSATAISDADFDDILAYCNTRYALSL